MLYLDKCWRELQLLLRGLVTDGPRPSFELVRGQVTHTQYSWIPFVRFLEPDEVAAIAVDLADVPVADIRALSRRRDRLPYPHDEDTEVRYVEQHLASAVEFTRRLADSGRGLVYLIG